MTLRFLDVLGQKFFQEMDLILQRIRIPEKPCEIFGSPPATELPGRVEILPI